MTIIADNTTVAQSALDSPHHMGVAPHTKDEPLSAPAPDARQAMAFLRAWNPDGTWTLAAIPPEGGAPIIANFDPTNEANAVAWIERHQGERNLYFSVNETVKGLNKKAEKTDIARAIGLHVDIDPRVGENLDDEHRRIHARLDAFTPAPTAVLFSGGGYQAFWKFPAPLDINGEQARWEPVERINRALELEFEADSCHNIDRLMRLPGTVNVPSARKRAKGRTTRVATLHFCDAGQTITPADFEALCNRHGVTTIHAPSPASAADRLTAIPAHVDLSPLPPWARSLIKAGVCEGRSYASRSEAVLAISCEMVRCKFDDGQIAAILLDPDNAISAHVLEKGRSAGSYALRQAARARVLVEEEFEANEKKVPYAKSARNIRIAITKLRVEVALNEFDGRYEVRGLAGFGPQLDDGAMDRLWLAIDERFKFRPDRQLFETVVRDEARANRHHPVREFLDGLTWDGQPRVERWLIDYLGADDTPLNRAIGSMMLVGAVRRVREPGVKFDEMVVLEGAQGAGKSSALNLLAMDDAWFADDLPLDGDSKRVIEAIEGKWIVEASELSSLNRASNEHLKALLSRSHDRARRPYERMAVDIPRQCIFVGTTNADTYLRDTTGNRRFLPVRVGSIDLEGLKRDRAQLWAEAARIEAAGEQVGVPRALWEDAATQQFNRLIEDPYYERLSEVLGSALGKLSAEDAWAILDIPPGRRTQQDGRRMGDALRRLGFKRTKLRFGARSPQYAYVRGEGASLPRLWPQQQLDETGGTPF